MTTDIAETIARVLHEALYAGPDDVLQIPAADVLRVAYAAEAGIAARDAAAWRPIETAPMDGTLILGWNGRWIEIAMWQRANAINPPLWRGAHCGVSHIDQPTHWLPLPTQPEAK